MLRLVVKILAMGEVLGLLMLMIILPVLTPLKPPLTLSTQSRVLLSL